MPTISQGLRSTSAPRGAPVTSSGSLGKELFVIEVVVNGRVVASREVAADGQLHPVQFPVPIERSSWVALRQFPQLHTSPVNVLVAGRPIRASRQSALWALACIDQLWRARSQRIAPAERGAAEKAYEEARAFYRRAANEATDEH